MGEFLRMARGGGASRLVDALIENGFRAVTVLDLSEAALMATKARLGSRAEQVQWVVADVTEWEPHGLAYDIWHDRAAFHFLTEEPDRMAYVARLIKAVKPGGHAIMVKHFASLLGARHIRVNAVAPGVVATDMSNFTKTDAGRDFALGMRAFKRLAEPDDIGGLVAFRLRRRPVDHRRYRPRRWRIEALKQSIWLISFWSTSCWVVDPDFKSGARRRRSFLRSVARRLSVAKIRLSLGHLGRFGWRS